MSSVWPVMIAVGLLTYAMRLSFILLLGRLEMPPLLLRALRYVPPAVLTAIIFPEVVMPGGQFNLSLTNYRLPAALLAALVAWRTRNAVITVAAGMLILLALQSLL